MSSKRHLRRQMCGRKIALDTLEEAIAMAGRMGHLHQQTFHAYACSNCGKFHIGHPQVHHQKKRRAEFSRG